MPICQKLQLDSSQTLSKAVQQARKAEAIKQQQLLLRGGGHNVGVKEHHTPVGAVGRGRSQRRHSRLNPGAQSTKMCGRCGRSWHDRQQSPGWDAVCHKCARKGHFKSMCRSTAEIQEVQLKNPGSRVHTPLCIPIQLWMMDTDRGMKSLELREKISCSTPEKGAPCHHQPDSPGASPVLQKYLTAREAYEMRKPKSSWSGRFVS